MYLNTLFVYIGYSEHMPHQFHISLGYQFKKFTDKQSVNVITEAVEQALRDVLGHDYATVDLQVSSGVGHFYSLSFKALF